MAARSRSIVGLNSAFELYAHAVQAGRSLLKVVEDHDAHQTTNLVETLL